MCKHVNVWYNKYKYVNLLHKRPFPDSTKKMIDATANLPHRYLVKHIKTFWGQTFPYLPFWKFQKNQRRRPEGTNCVPYFQGIHFNLTRPACFVVIGLTIQTGSTSPGQRGGGLYKLARKVWLEGVSKWEEGGKKNPISGSCWIRWMRMRGALREVATLTSLMLFSLDTLRLKRAYQLPGAPSAGKRHNLDGGLCECVGVRDFPQHEAYQDHSSATCACNLIMLLTHIMSPSWLF